MNYDSLSLHISCHEEVLPTELWHTITKFFGMKFCLYIVTYEILSLYKVVQIWPGQTVTYLHTNRPSHIWTTLYY
jgi:hypothetical protein